MPAGSADVPASGVDASGQVGSTGNFELILQCSAVRPDGKRMCKTEVLKATKNTKYIGFHDLTATLQPGPDVAEREEEERRRREEEAARIAAAEALVRSAFASSCYSWLGDLLPGEAHLLGVHDIVQSAQFILSPQ